MWVQSGCGLWLCLSAFWRVRWLRLAGFRACPLLSCRVPSFGRVFRPFVGFIALGALLANMALFRVFRGF